MTKSVFRVITDRGEFEVRSDSPVPNFEATATLMRALMSLSDQCRQLGDCAITVKRDGGRIFRSQILVLDDDGNSSLSLQTVVEVVAQEDV